jgi:hypothetical protein
MRHQRFIPSPSQLSPASFNADFSAVAHDQNLLGSSRTAWFDACLCRPTPRGLPSSPSVVGKNRSLSSSFHVALPGQYGVWCPRPAVLRPYWSPFVGRYMSKYDARGFVTASRSATHQSLPQKSKFAPSSRRIVCRASRISPLRAASRIFAGASRRVIELVADYNVQAAFAE